MVTVGRTGSFTSVFIVPPSAKGTPPETPRERNGGCEGATSPVLQSGCRPGTRPLYVDDTE